VDAKKYFDSYPSVDKFYFTTDGMAFADESKAKAHQKSLNGKPEMMKVESRNKKTDSKTDKL